MGAIEHRNELAALSGTSAANAQKMSGADLAYAATLALTGNTANNKKGSTQMLVEAGPTIRKNNQNHI